MTGPLQVANVPRLRFHAGAHVDAAIRESTAFSVESTAEVSATLTGADLAIAPTPAGAPPAPPSDGPGSPIRPGDPRPSGRGARTPGCLSDDAGAARDAGDLAVASAVRPGATNAARQSGALSNTPRIGPPRPLNARESLVVDPPHRIGPPHPVRCLGSRVDWLTIAFKVRPFARVVRELARCGELLAAHRGRVAASLDGWEASVQQRGREAWVWATGDARGLFDPNASGGWSVEVTVSNAFLRAHQIEDCIALCRSVAARFGDVDGVRVRRVDLAADFAGWALAMSDVERFIFPRNGGGAAFRPSEDDVAGKTPTAVQVYMRAAAKVTGFTICPGNPLMARIYDKRAQLRALNDRDRTECEEAVWRGAGWHGEEPVTRVEAQFRKEILDELELRDPATIADRLDAAWKYFCGDGDGEGVHKGWLRIVDAASRRSRKRRREADPRWRAVREVHFVHAHVAAAARRPRPRVAARVAQGLGAQRSALSACGELPPFCFVRGATGEFVDERDFGTEADFVAALEPHEHEAAVRHYLANLSRTFARVAAEEEIGQRGAAAALLRFVIHHREVRARFSTDVLRAAVVTAVA